MTQASNQQKAHYERIHDAYTDHYFDHWSTRFRQKFWYPRLFKDLDFNHKQVAELACSSGQNSRYLQERFPHVKLTGYDISEDACAQYQQNLNAPCHQLNLCTDPLPQAQFDVCFIVGGLHHCIVDLPFTVSNISQALKPGGLFLMIEPNAAFLGQKVREVWYRRDVLFDHETERALSEQEIRRLVDQKLDVTSFEYGGGPAYILTLNSLLFRMPKWLKNAISPPLFLLEKLYDMLPGRLWFPYFVAHCQRRGKA